MWTNKNVGRRSFYLRALGVLLLTFGTSAALAQHSPVVSTVEVSEQSVAASIELIGTLKANQAVAIAPQVSARVTDVHFVPGEAIKKDQLLLSLDDRIEQATLREAQASLMNAQRVLKNYQTLYQRKAVTQTELEGQQATVAMAEAKVAAAKASVEQLTLRAPFAGVIGLTDVAPGMLLSANSEVAELLDIETLKLDVAVPEKYFSQLVVGEPLLARSDAYREQMFTGELAVISPNVNPDTLNAKVRIVFDNADRLLTPGMLMRVQMTIDNRQLLTIPSQSLLYAGQERYVYVVDEENKVSKRTVKVERNLGELVTIADGLSLGEQVISEGTVKVRPGMTVEVVNEAL